MSDIVIAEGTVVTLNFAVKIAGGEVVDSTFDTEPATFTMGDGNLLPGFEEPLTGLSSGSKATFSITPEQGFGQHNPSNIQIMPRDQFEDEITLEKGLVLSFADAQNTELPGVVTGFDKDEVIVDFNHPLAGKNIEFEVEIIDVQAAVTH